MKLALVALGHASLSDVNLLRSQEYTGLRYAVLGIRLPKKNRENATRLSVECQTFVLFVQNPRKHGLTPDREREHPLKKIDENPNEGYA